MTPAFLLLAAAAGQLLDRPPPGPPQIGVWDIRSRMGACDARLVLADGTELDISHHRGRDHSSLSVQSPAWTDIKGAARYRLAVRVRPGAASISGEATGRRFAAPDERYGILSMRQGGRAILRRMGVATEIEVAIDGRPRGRFAIPGAGAAMAELYRCAVRAHRPGARTPPGIASFFRVSDYPEAAVRAGEEGTVGFRLVIAADGRVSDCLVTSPSGSAALDEATCRILRARVRYRPAAGADEPVATDYGTVTWTQPR